MALDIVIALGLVAANGFFVAVEFSLTRVRPTQLADWERQNRAGVGAVRHGVERLDAYLAACQLGITLASLGLGVVGEPAFHDLLEPWLGDEASLLGFGLATAVAFFTITMLHVVLGELSPKSLAISRTGRTVRWVAPPMRVFYLATKPVVDLFNGMGNLLLKPFGIPPAREVGHAPHSEEELQSLVRESGEHGVLEGEERRLTQAALAFDDRRVRGVLRPRREVVTLHAGMSADEVIARARASGRTRFPLLEDEGGDLDDAIGVVHLKDVVLGTGELDLRGCARTLHRVPDSAFLPEVMRELRRHRQRMAVVVDEHGTALGVVTIQDLVEELFGEIEDEFGDERAGWIDREPSGAAVIDGAAPLALVREELGVEVPEVQETTIGGAVVERLGRLPERGERIEVGDLRAEVLEVGDGLLRRLRIHP